MDSTWAKDTRHNSAQEHKAAGSLLTHGSCTCWRGGLSKVAAMATSFNESLHTACIWHTTAITSCREPIQRTQHRPYQTHGDQKQHLARCKPPLSQVQATPALQASWPAADSKPTKLMVHAALLGGAVALLLQNHQ
jgi:hypothetical protein